FIESGANIANNVTIKNLVTIWEGVTIENDVFVGPNVVFTNDLQDNLIQKKILLYIGSTGTWYPLDKMIDFFKVIKNNEESDLFFLFLINDKKEKVVDLITQLNMSHNDFTVKNVPGREVINYIHASDYGIAFIKNIFSKIASSPIKNGELILGKTPIICNDIGDNKLLISKDIGYVIKNFNQDEYLTGFRHIKNINPDSEMFNIARENLLKNYLGLAEGANRYQQIYKEVINE
ncbi:MAG: hypothetical protein HQK51_11415, partial [Oligoflexia bacterium]|nr:hypothetical protein [Oligoflexia bacterium]